MCALRCLLRVGKKNPCRCVDSYLNKDCLRVDVNANVNVSDYLSAPLSLVITCSLSSLS